MNKIGNPLKELRDEYRRSLTKAPFKLYTKIGLIAGVSTFLISFTVGFVFHSFYDTTLFTKLSMSLLLSIILTLVVEFVVLIYPHYMSSVQRNRVENSLIYTISYMTILANSGFSIERMISRAAEIEKNKVVKELLSTFLSDISVFGFDVEKSLKRLSNRSPSRDFARFIDSVNNAIWTSGELEDIMRYQFYTQIQKKKENTEKMINSLTFLSEIYVAVMVVSPVMFIIMFTLLSALSINAGGFASVTILNWIVFIGLPILGAGFIIVLDTMRGTE
jgi:flagellar protein FlaJ